MKRSTILIPLAVVLLIGSTTASAQRTNEPAAPQSGFDLSWSTIAGGGVTSGTGGPYSLNGTAGQANAGAMSGGTYQLTGGLWSGATVDYHIYLPLALKNS